MVSMAAGVLVVLGPFTPATARALLTGPHITGTSRQAAIDVVSVLDPHLAGWEGRMATRSLCGTVVRMCGPYGMSHMACGCSMWPVTCSMGAQHGPDCVLNPPGRLSLVAEMSKLKIAGVQIAGCRLQIRWSGRDYCRGNRRGNCRGKNDKLPSGSQRLSLIGACCTLCTSCICCICSSLG